MTDLMLPILAAETLPTDMNMRHGSGAEMSELVEAMVRMPTSDADRAGEPLLVCGDVWSSDLPEEQRYVMRVIGARTGRHHGEITVLMPFDEDSEDIVADLAGALQVAVNAGHDAPDSRRVSRAVPIRVVEKAPAL